MNILKWVMKQYWRIGTIRGMLSLALSMFVLGRLFYLNVPYLRDLGLLGALILGSLLTFLFIFLGWVYDEKAKMWSASIQASQERNPFSYVPNFRTLAFDYPMLYAVNAFMKNLFQKIDKPTNNLADLITFLNGHYRKRPCKTDIWESKEWSETFFQKHGFEHGNKSKQNKVSISGKLKLGFQVEKTRLNWIQGITGLAQDALVFGTFYITLLVPVASVGDTIPLDYLILGVVFISIPILIILAVIGWFYDKKLQAWSPERVVLMERNPYSYVPQPRFHTYDLPFLYTSLALIKQFIQKEDVEIAEMNNLTSYLAKYSSFSSRKETDMEASRLQRNRYGQLFTRHHRGATRDEN